MLLRLRSPYTTIPVKVKAIYVSIQLINNKKTFSVGLCSKISQIVFLIVRNNGLVSGIASSGITSSGLHSGHVISSALYAYLKIVLFIH